MAKTKDTLYTVFLEFQASFSEEARILSKDPAITRAQREGREPLTPETVQFIEEFYRTEEALAGLRRSTMRMTYIRRSRHGTRVPWLMHLLAIDLRPAGGHHHPREHDP